ncbi:glycerate kinase [Shimia sp.]|uniref:glycerate kinase type-2 family protein n=1 Tax=Shimia sp. TaxID=1954381 RepID=UPI003565ACDE
MDAEAVKTVEDIWWHGVRAVRGAEAVSKAIRRQQIAAPDRIIAVGKAASAMLEGAQAVYGTAIPALVVTKYGHATPLPAAQRDRVRVIEAAHPVPDENTLVAGVEILKEVQHMAPQSHLLMLVSGGASSLAELPEPGLSLAALQHENARLLGDGLDIHAMNARRRELSQIKGGKLLGHFAGARVTTLAISDVEGDSLSVIGSGIGQAPDNHRFSFDPHIVASNRIARTACAARARTLGLAVRGNEETLYADVHELAARLGPELRAAPAGLYIWGGEPTIQLPPDPGQGGRNQALALALAREISGLYGLTVLVAGSDGTDGPTDAAGGVVNGATWTDEAARFQRQADSGRFLDARSALFRSGPTGTNVMDLVVALKT